MIIRQTTETLAQIADSIRRGGVIAFRTDTFYGLGADPFNRDAVSKIRQLKGRDDRKPILIVVSERDQIDRFVAERNNAFELLMERFWPGSLTLVGKSAPNLPEDITAGTGTVGVRLPDDDRVRALVRACGGALTATSANPSDQEPAKTAREVHKYFGDELELIVDGGPARTDLPSTVIDVSGPEPGLIREGVIAWADVQTLMEPG